MIPIPSEIKELYHQDHCYKNIRIHFPNGERSDICNNLIVKDSVSFTESLCSQNTLKFGLCESPIFECEVVGVGNIKGATIEVSCEIECPATVEDAAWRTDIQKYVYSIPYGTYVVDSARRQADMIHRKIVAYNLLGVSDFRMTNFQVYRANYPVSQEVSFAQSIVGLISENVQDNAFGCEMTEITLDDLETAHWGSGGQNPRYTYWNCKVMRITPSNSNALYRIVVNDPDFDKLLIQYERAEYATHGINRFLTDGLYFPSLIARVYPPPWFTAEYYTSLEYIYPYMSMPSSDANTYYKTSDVHNQGFYIVILYERVIVQGDDTYVTTFCSPDDIHLYELTITDTTQFYYKRIRNENNKYTVENPSELSLRSLFEGYAETKGIFCGLNRFNHFFQMNIKQQFGLDPDSDLYPSSSLYPEGVTGGKLLPEDYQSCWYNDDYTLPFGRIECTFKDTNNLENVYTLYLTGFDEDSDVNSYRVYYLTDNYLINNSLWTEAQIEAICNRIADNLEGVRYMPVEFVGRGLPYVEAGDTFEILTKSSDSITTIVLNRTITGEQTLTDSYKSV